MERHHTSLEDIKRAARVADALPNIDFIMSFAHPHELNPAVAYLASFQAMAENSTKPIVPTAEGRPDLAAMWEISKILRGGEAEYRKKPYWVQYAEPISPLKHPFTSLDKLIFCSETGSPVIYSPAPIAGSTAPMTIAGHVVQGLSEALNLAERSGLDAKLVLDVISKGAAQSWQMENRGATMVDDEFEFGFAVDWMRKDLDICLAQGHRVGALLPLTALVNEFYARVQARGGGRWDTSSLMRLLTNP